MSSNSEVCLQINLSPGDIDYALLTVPRLSAMHRAEVREVLAVVDCCRPQRTSILDPDLRFPTPVYAKKVGMIKEIASQLKNSGYIDRVVFLQPRDKILADLSRKYLSGLTSYTHDYGGCGLMSYLAGIELVDTSFVLHYDADMLLYQDNSYSWVSEAVQLMALHKNVIAASPRISPPFRVTSKVSDAPSLHEGRPLMPVVGGWLNDWFSTRCFLLDQAKLKRYLPFAHMNTLWIELVLRKILRRGFPLSPEIMLFKGPGKAGARRLNLSSTKSWLLHPTTKPSSYIELLPTIINLVSMGLCPESQKGHSDINISAWMSMLTNHDSLSVCQATTDQC